MFWSKDKKPNANKRANKQNRDKRQKTDTCGNKKVSVGTIHKGQRTRDELESQALANMQDAREHIGNDVLERINQAVNAKDTSPASKAKDLIRAAEPDSVLYDLRHLIDN